MCLVDASESVPVVSHQGCLDAVFYVLSRNRFRIAAAILKIKKRWVLICEMRSWLVSRQGERPRGGIPPWWTRISGEASPSVRWLARSICGVSSRELGKPLPTQLSANLPGGVAWRRCCLRKLYRSNELHDSAIFGRWPRTRGRIGFENLRFYLDSD